MTQEQILEILDSYKLRIPPTVFYDLKADIVNYEEQEPTTKNDLGVDCISRADAIRVASGYCHPSNVAKELAKLPSVTPQEPKMGHWIVHPKGIYAHLVCNKCLSCAPYDCKTNYCPNCGTKMEESEADNG